MFECLSLFLQCFLLVFLQVGICELIHLETQIFLVFLATLRLFQGFLQLLFEATEFFVFVFVGGKLFLMPCKNVEHTYLEVLFA